MGQRVCVLSGERCVSSLTLALERRSRSFSPLVLPSNCLTRIVGAFFLHGDTAQEMVGTDGRCVTLKLALFGFLGPFTIESQ